MIEKFERRVHRIAHEKMVQKLRILRMNPSLWMIRKILCLCKNTENYKYKYAYPASPALSGEFFTTAPPGKPPSINMFTHVPNFWKIIDKGLEQMANWIQRDIWRQRKKKWKTLRNVYKWKAALILWRWRENRMITYSENKCFYQIPGVGKKHLRKLIKHP